MRIHEAMAMHQDLVELGKLQAPKEKGGKYNYAVLRNMRKIEKAVKHLHHTFPIDGVRNREYDAERIELLNEHCDKDDNGDPVIEGGIYIGIEGNESFDEKIEVLNKGYKDVLDAKESIYNEEFEIDFFKVLPDFLPSMDTDDIARIEFMIRES